jgi:alkanesulfonate monooxygenase SsuD/methylene tetrahydromethanopterin reductase-like flavin-dependent oxidoreductase (luciferase family)
MHVGIYTDLRNPPRWERPWRTFYDTVLDRIAAAEDLGLHSVWLSEHHFFEDGYLPQPLTFAAAIATRTSRIRIGTAVMLAPLRPAVDIAEQAAVVDLLSGGRLDLGLGAGYRVPEFEAYGVDIKDRFPLLEDRVETIRALWEQGTVTPAPLQERLPIWVGIHGPRGARIAGRLGEGVLAFDAKLREPYLTALDEHGHGAASARYAGVVNMIVSDDPEGAWPRIAPHLAYQWSSYRHYGAEGTDGLRSQTVAAVPDDLDPASLRHPGPEMPPPRFDVVTPDEAVRRLQAWLGGLPVETVFFWESIAGMPDDLAERHVELLAREVAPRVA